MTNDALAKYLKEIEILRDNGDHEAAYIRASSLARDYPQDIRSQKMAAYTCDRLGHEIEAARHYERALELGFRICDDIEFAIGLGATLRNVGRPQDAVNYLQQAFERAPDNPILQAFLALALYSAGDTRRALALMLQAALTASSPDGFGGYERALAEYQEELLSSE